MRRAVLMLAASILCMGQTCAPVPSLESPQVFYGIPEGTYIGSIPGSFSLVYDTVKTDTNPKSFAKAFNTQGSLLDENGYPVKYGLSRYEVSSNPYAELSAVVMYMEKDVGTFVIESSILYIMEISEGYNRALVGTETERFQDLGNGSVYYEYSLVMSSESVGLSPIYLEESYQGALTR